MVKASSFAVITLATFFSACTVSLSASSTDAPKKTPNAAGQPSSSVDASRKLKNAPIPSAGRGKELGDFKSGTYTIDERRAYPPIHH